MVILAFGRGDISHFGTQFETIVAICGADYHRVIVKVKGNHGP
jgi:hypothetical protein